MRFHRLVLFGIIVFSGLSCSLARAGDFSHCDVLSTAPYDREPELDARTQGVIQKHPIWRLAREFDQSGKFIEFELGEGLDIQKPGAMGYVVQRRMLKALLGMIFPNNPIRSEARHWLDAFHRNVKPVILFPEDSALNPDYTLNQEPKRSTTLQMMRLKMGNPQVFHLNRTEIRKRWGIPESSRVLSVYGTFRTSSELRNILAVIEQFRDQPDFIFLSLTRNESLKSVSKMAPLGYSVNALSNLSEHPLKIKKSRWPTFFRPRPTLILNDTRGRLPELYTASDFALVSGPNNFFEPLLVKCPTLIYPEWREPYSESAYDFMVEGAVATGGAVVVHGTLDAQSAYERVRQIHSSEIAHPAFVSPRPGMKTGLELLLDRIEAMIRSQ